MIWKKYGEGKNKNREDKELEDVRKYKKRIQEGRYKL